MIKLFFLIVFLFLGTYPLRADDALGNDQDFMNELDNIKNPFEDGIPKPAPVIVHAPPVVVYKPVKVIPKIKPKPLPVVLPDLKLQGVMVGGDMNEAIINDQSVSLLGYIKGAQVISVSKDGVGLLYKGKKFFIKVD
jgi:hypothetical protein